MKEMVRALPDWLAVSRETSERMEAFVALLLHWNQTINLISKGSAADLWPRHVLDSAQLMPHIPDAARALADFGSGGGFPGIILAIIAAEQRPQMRMTLIESDLRKAVFLTEACRKLGLTVTVLRERVESLPALQADVITARALAPLATLCAYAHRHLAPGGTALFLKGNSHPAEIAAARQSWSFDLTVHESRTEAGTAVLALKGIAHV